MAFFQEEMNVRLGDRTITFANANVGADRSSRGKIYRHRITIDHTYHRPFPR